MKNFESVYKELENLFINKLPEYIEKINKEHNDGIILKSFENKSLEENCIKTPSFSFKLEETEYEEKDRIIESEKYTFSIEIKVDTQKINENIILFRYIESINIMLSSEDLKNLIKIQKIMNTKIWIQYTTK